MPLQLIFLLLTLFLPFFVSSALVFFLARYLDYTNERKRDELLQRLGYDEDEAFSKHIVGLFHPYCAAGGGGERVLWTAVAHMQKRSKDLVCVVYTGDTNFSKDEIIAKVESRFRISLDPKALDFVYLKSRWLVEDSLWPVFTVLGQSIGSIWLAVEAMWGLIPDLYIDTMGYSFTYPVVRILAPDIRLGAYVHYPTISTTMLTRVRERTENYANSSTISQSKFLSTAKLIYYTVFHYLYGAALRNTTFMMVNSSWTRGHVVSVVQSSQPRLSRLVNILTRLLWWLPDEGNEWRDDPSLVKTVYPPCDIASLENFDLEDRENVIVSVAQFRPEKAHAVQLQALHELFEAHPTYREGKDAIQLVLIGGCRDKADEKRVEQLKSLAKELKIEDNVKIIINAPYSEVLNWLRRSSIGISTMVDEHFGINIVEYMGAGLIPLAHASGGPLLDIVLSDITDPSAPGSKTGYHATTPGSFANSIARIMSLSPDERTRIRERARERAKETFSEEMFVAGWDMVVGPWLY